MTRIGVHVLALFVASCIAPNQALAQRPRSVAFSAIAGSGIATALAIGQDGSIFVTGFRPDTRGTNQFPFTARIGDGPGRTFIVKLDPTGSKIQYATLIGADVDAFGIAVDSSGSVVVVGGANGPGLTTVNALYPSYLGGQDGFVLKLTPDGSKLVFSTYFGGSAYDHIDTVKLTPDGQIHLAGGTDSPDFPANRRIGSTQALSIENSDVFYARLTADGTRIITSTLIGGSKDDWLTGMDLAPDNGIILAGWTDSDNFPVQNAPQPKFGDVIQPGREARDGFILRLNPAGNTLEFSTYWGGTLFDQIQGMAVREDGVVIVAGSTNSPSFPLCASRGNIFVSAIDSQTGQARWSTCFGGSSFDNVADVAISADAEEIYVAGNTTSIDFPQDSPSVFGCLKPPAGTAGNAFLATIDRSGNRVGSMLIGGDADDSVFAVRALTGGGVLLAGTTESAAFPTGPRGFLGSRVGPQSAWVMQLANQPPRISLNRVVDSASFADGPVTPGEIVSLFGYPIGPDCATPFETFDGIPETLRGVRVLFNGRPGIPLFVSKRQVNVEAPFELSGPVKIELEVDGIRSNPIERQLSVANPAIFLLDESSRAAAINQDGSLNTAATPAAPGSNVSIYLSGGGVSVQNGLVQVEAIVGGRNAVVQRAGAAPGLIFGILQVILRIPIDTPPGDAVPIQVRISGAASAPGRFLAVR